MSDTKPEGKTTRLRITGCTVGYTGKNKRGDDYVIHEVLAQRENGEQVNEKLRSFEDLPIGELIDLIVTPFDSEKYGRSFTLARKNKIGAHQRINELKAEVADLTGRIERVETWARSKATVAPEGTVDGRVPAQIAHEQRLAEMANQGTLDERFGGAGRSR